MYVFIRVYCLCSYTYINYATEVTRREYWRWEYSPMSPFWLSDEFSVHSSDSSWIVNIRNTPESVL